MRDGHKIKMQIGRKEQEMKTEYWKQKRKEKIKRNRLKAFQILLKDNIIHSIFTIYLGLRLKCK